MKSPQFPSLTVPEGSSRNGEELSSAFVKLVFHVPSRAVGLLFGDGLAEAGEHGSMTSGVKWPDARRAVMAAIVAFVVGSFDISSMTGCSRSRKASSCCLEADLIEKPAAQNLVLDSLALSRRRVATS